MQKEERREPRQEVSRPARIEIGDGRIVMCRIANIARRGALLLVDESEWLPKFFELFDKFSGSRWEAQVMWTSQNRAGVRFLSGVRAATEKKTVGFGKRV